MKSIQKALFRCGLRHFHPHFSRSPGRQSRTRYIASWVLKRMARALPVFSVLTERSPSAGAQGLEKWSIRL